VQPRCVHATIAYVSMCMSMYLSHGDEILLFWVGKCWVCIRHDIEDCSGRVGLGKSNMNTAPERCEIDLTTIFDSGVNYVVETVGEIN
jgi:hypothetical protein